MPSNNPSIHMLYKCCSVPFIHFHHNFEVPHSLNSIYAPVLHILSSSMCSKDLSYAIIYATFLLRIVPKRIRARLLLTSLMKRRLQKRNKKDRKELGGKTAMKVGGEMELVNLKLYWENRSIMEENKRLREKALLLRQENRVLISRLLATKSVSSAISANYKS